MDKVHPHIKAMQALVEKDFADTIARYERLAAEETDERYRKSWVNLAATFRAMKFPWDNDESPLKIDASTGSR
jgi:hypothetical protein